MDLPEPVGTGDEHGAVGLVEGAFEALALGVGHAELLELHHDGVLVEDAHHDRLAVDARERDHAQIDMAAIDGEADAPVLGQAPLGDVELGHDLHARDHAGGHAPRDGGDVLQDAVDAQAHAHLVAVGGEVNVGGAALDGLGDDLVDELDDRRVLGGLAQVDDLGVALFGSPLRVGSRPRRRHPGASMREIRSPMPPARRPRRALHSRS